MCYCDHDGTQVGMPCPFCGRLNMNPTPTPPKTHAEVAKKLWKRLLDADVDACNPDCDDQTRGPVAILTTALREAKNEGIAIGTAVKPDKGFIMDDAGNVRRVEGHGLAISADGVVLTPGARAWRLDDTDPIDGEPFEGWVVLSVDRGECETQRFRWVTISGIGEATAHSLYSTLAAALHAKDAHAGEKGAANGK